jgi:hypothetical protein
MLPKAVLARIVFIDSSYGMTGKGKLVEQQY